MRHALELPGEEAGPAQEANYSAEAHSEFDQIAVTDRTSSAGTAAEAPPPPRSPGTDNAEDDSNLGHGAFDDKVGDGYGDDGGGRSFCEEEDEAETVVAAAELDYQRIQAATMFQRLMAATEAVRENGGDLASSAAAIASPPPKAKRRSDGDDGAEDGQSGQSDDADEEDSLGQGEAVALVTAALLQRLATVKENPAR